MMNIYLTDTDEDAVVDSAGRSLGFYLSMFVSEICKQSSNISNHGVESVNQTEK